MLIVTKQFSISDWLFLYYIAVNLEPYVFRSVFLQIADEIRTPTNTTSEEEEEDLIPEVLPPQAPHAPYKNLLNFEDERERLTIDTVDGIFNNKNNDDIDIVDDDKESSKEKHVKFA